MDPPSGTCPLRKRIRKLLKTLGPKTSASKTLTDIDVISANIAFLAHHKFGTDIDRLKISVTVAFDPHTHEFTITVVRHVRPGALEIIAEGVRASSKDSYVALDDVVDGKIIQIRSWVLGLCK